ELSRSNGRERAWRIGKPKILCTKRVEVRGRVEHIARPRLVDTHQAPDVRSIDPGAPLPDEIAPGEQPDSVGGITPPREYRIARCRRGIGAASIARDTAGRIRRVPTPRERSIRSAGSLVAVTSRAVSFVEADVVREAVRSRASVEWVAHKRHV